jgi:Zn-dependent protease with chaperone function
MSGKTQITKMGFIKPYVIPILIMFVVPGFSLWFFNHVEGHYDAEIRESLVNQIQTDSTLTTEQRKELVHIYGRLSIAKLLASNNPEVRKLQSNFESVSGRYTVFRWMKRISWLCLLMGVAALVAGGIGVLFSFRSQNALYWSLRLGWYVLRWFALVEVVGQGILAVALSFWMTAFWTERYFLKLILIVGVLAGGAVLLLIKAIFRRLPTHNEFEGRLLKKQSALLLWERVVQMADKMGIAPPDHIFVGIDDNFFVTEHPVKVNECAYQGRTLFVSLSLLKMLTRGEAEAVLAHELAHFSGDDTVYSRRISPLLGKYVHYLEALHHGRISLPVFYFMFFFWNLYQMALGKLSRAREFRADRIGAEFTSPHDASQALVKISAYCRYRRDVQEKLFEQTQTVEFMDVSQRIATGFPDFMKACVTGTELADADTPHPFDSHPPLQSRIENLGLDPKTVLQTPSTLPALNDSWYSGIEDASAIEAEEWKSFEDRMHKAHQESLAYRFKPEGDAEIQHVVKYFPEVQFTSSKGETATIDYEKIALSQWEGPLLFSQIEGCELTENIGQARLKITWKVVGDEKPKTCKVAYKEFQKEGADFLKTFQDYYGRYLFAKQYHEQKAIMDSV